MADVALWVLGAPATVYVLLLVMVKAVGVGKPYEDLERRRQQR